MTNIQIIPAEAGRYETWQYDDQNKTVCKFPVIGWRITSDDEHDGDGVLTTPVLFQDEDWIVTGGTLLVDLHKRKGTDPHGESYWHDLSELFERNGWDVDPSA